MALPPTVSVSVLIRKRQGDTETQTEGESGEWGVGNDAETEGHMPQGAWRPQKLEQARRTLPRNSGSPRCPLCPACLPGPPSAPTTILPKTDFYTWNLRL